MTRPLATIAALTLAALLWRAFRSATIEIGRR